MSGILEWVQTFGIYMAVLCQKQPYRIQDLLGYQILIIEASLEYQGDGWMGYDRQFRQRVAANPALAWANIDTTLWNLTFSGQPGASHYHHCFSLCLNTSQCNWAPVLRPHTISHSLLHQSPHKQSPICRAWNSDPHPFCPIPVCSYRHICWNCYSDTHKGFYFPHSGCPTTAPGRSQHFC